MNIKQTPPVQILPPQPEHIAGLRILWKEAFDDTDAFLDVFFSTAFAPNRCLCILNDNTVIAALYWFECEYLSQPLAYIYAVATAKAYRGMGLCRQLLAAAHSTLKQQGYLGALLVPGSETLFDFYKKAGYQTTCYRHIFQYDLNTSANNCCRTKQISPTASLAVASIFTLNQISASEYATLRKNFLPPESVLQEKENLHFMQKQLNFYSGEHCLAAVAITEQTLYCAEFLYTDCIDTTTLASECSLPNHSCNQDLFHDLLCYFNCTSGVFCTPGNTSPFAMYYPLNDSNVKTPTYFAFAFD